MLSRLLLALIVGSTLIGPAAADEWESHDRTSLLRGTPIISRTVTASQVSKGDPDSFQFEVRCDEGNFGFYVMSDRIDPGAFIGDRESPGLLSFDGQEPVRSVLYSARVAGEVKLEPFDLSSNEKTDAFFDAFGQHDRLVVRLPFPTGRIDAEFPIGGLKQHANAATAECKGRRL